MRSYWMRMGSKSKDRVLIQHIRGHRKTQGEESNVLTEARTGVMWLQARGCQGLPAASGSKEARTFSPSEPLEGANSADTWTWSISSTVRELTSAVLSHLVGCVSLQQPQDTNTSVRGK